MATRPRQPPQVNYSAGLGRGVFGQSAGLVASVAAHVVVVAVIAIGWFPVAPIDASQIEQIPVDFVEMADDTKINKGIRTAALVQEVPVSEPAEKIVEEPPPLPKPDPVPDPEPAPPLPPPPAPAPPQPQPPDPAPQPDVTPPVPTEAAPPPEPTPEPEAPPPPEKAAVVPPKDTPMPRIRPSRPQKPVEAPDTAKSDIDQIQALLDKRKLEQLAAAEPTPQTEPTVGSETGSASVAKMTANELDALRARLAQCWSPPLGWTDPAEVRVVLMLELNQDGTVAGTSVVQSPQGQYSNTAPESALRAVRRCAPFDLPPDKYGDWKQVKVTFDPRDMG